MARKSLKSQIKVEHTTETEVEQKPLRKQIAKSTTKGKNYVMDLRVHSPASLSYLGLDGIDTAPALVSLAKVKGLDLIAVTDYFSGKFVDSVVLAAKDTCVTVIPGVVIRCILGSCEDVILTCLFPEDTTSARIESFLRELQIPTSASGKESYCLQLPFDKILRTIEKYNGMALPSRMDKTPHRVGVIAQMVEQYGFRAFDLAYPESKDFFKRNWPKIKFQLFSFSSAHSLAQVGSRTARVKMSAPSFAGLRVIVERELR